MNIVIVPTEVFEQKRNERVVRFCEAQLKLIDSVEIMVANAHAVTTDPVHRKSLDSLIGQMVTKQTELALLMGLLFPSQQ